MNITIPKPSNWFDPYASWEQKEQAIHEALKVEGEKLGVSLILTNNTVGYRELDSGHLYCHCYRWEPLMRPIVKDVTEALTSMRKAGWKPKSIALPVDVWLTLPEVDLIGVDVTFDHGLVEGFVIRYYEPESLR